MSTANSSEQFSHAAALEAVLFASGESLSKKRLSSLLSISSEELKTAVSDLRAQLENRGLALIETEEELELRTSPHVASMVQKLRESELSRDLGKAGLEVLAIILYKNGASQSESGASRSEIDWVRGVNSAAALRSLTLRGLVARTEDATDRRRIRYTATIEALAHLGVSSVRDLPRYDEFAHALSAAEAEVVPEVSAVSNSEMSDEA